MDTELENIRNIGIIAHIDAGKTTTTERVLYYSGASHRMGSVDDGTTTTDFDEEEAKRGITIYSAAITCHWRDKTINLIDTPGHVDFTAEVERSLRVLDGAIVVFSAVEGVEAQSETVWRQANHYKVPRVCFINKMDRIGADFEQTFDEIKSRLEAHPIAMQVPMGAGSAPAPGYLTGIIDLYKMKALYFDPESKGADMREEEIPEEFQGLAEEWRSRLIEEVAQLDESLLEVYLETEDVPYDLFQKTLRAATLRGEVQPLFCGSSLDFIGVQPILDAVSDYLPSPLDMPPVEGDDPSGKKQGKLKRDCNPEEQFCGLVFKVVTDQHGEFHFIRVYSGTLKSGSRVLNPRTGKKELVSQLRRVQADSREKIETDEVYAGDIIGVIGLKDVATGDTLCDSKHPIALENIVFPETVISMAVEPDSSAERKKLEEVLDKLSRQDPTFKAKVSEETGQTIISGMGELHLEILKNRMEHDFNLKIKVHKPRVSYRETIKKAQEVSGEFSRTANSVTQYAQVKLRVEPSEEDAVKVESKLKPDALPPKMAELLKQSIKDVTQAGGAVGYPLIRVKLTILDVDYREGETTDVALQAAAGNAVYEALGKAGAVLLEPMMRLKVTTPHEFLGNIQSDLNARRALIVNSVQKGSLTVMEAEAALSQMFGYSTQVRSLSQGRASYSMEPLKYAEAPAEVLRDMMS
ncbi:Elongation factor G 1 [Polystyrenella longa]|uniref:Elongation factor G n=1 Tax=Polystyrenella longa TaxID=2528007 RepID=A0A518CR96_9PLAN|nr:elongation factor G [Polystyrenella longa]QDU81751.1 Elongation factor G 1 [Polystyrenella longa]